MSSVLERLGSATPRENVAKNRLLVVGAVAFALVAFVLYVPLGFYLESFLWRRRMAKRTPPTKSGR